MLNHSAKPTACTFLATGKVSSPTHYYFPNLVANRGFILILLPLSTTNTYPVVMNIMKIGLLTAGILCASLYPAADTHAQTLEEKIGQMLMVAVTNFGQPKDTLLIDIADRNLGWRAFFSRTTSPARSK